MRVLIFINSWRTILECACLVIIRHLYIWMLRPLETVQNLNGAVRAFKVVLSCINASRGLSPKFTKPLAWKWNDGQSLEEDGEGSPFPVVGLILPSLGDPKYGVAAFDQVFRECEAHRREGEFVICIWNFMEISLARNGQTKRERRIQIESLPSQFPDSAEMC